MGESKFGNYKSVAEKKGEDNFERIKSMQMDWRLEDDDSIVSFDVDLEKQLISYKTIRLDRKVKDDYGFYEKNWDVRHGEIRVVDENEIVDRFMFEYGDVLRPMLRLYNETLNLQYSEDENAKLVESFLKSSTIIKGEGFILLKMILYELIIIKEDTGKCIVPKDNKSIYYPKTMNEWQKGKSVAISWGDGGIKIFDIETGDLINNVDAENYVIGLKKSHNSKEIISWSYDKKIKFWDIDSSELVRTLDCPGGFPIVGDLIEIENGEVVVFSNGKETYMLDRNTGEIFKQFPGKNPKEDFRGGISVFNKGAIEFWRFKGRRGVAPSEVTVRGEKIINEWERFCEFNERNFSLEAGENEADIFWFEVSNLEAKRLEEKKQFEWGKERLYFHIKGKDLVKLNELIKNISSQNNIAISFKYYDVEKNGQPKNEVTRFVANFASVADAKKLYEKLAKNEEYRKMVADEDADYLGFQIDEKAHYASGYREIRKSDIEILKKKAESMIKNSDGTYTIKTLEGDLKLTVDEYEELLNEMDFSAKFKKIWDEGLSNSNNKAEANSSIKRAFRI